jgi:drug/metabolite transporter (DMT)-like permease
VLAGAIGFGGGGWCLFQAFPRIGSTLSLLVVECAAAIVAAALAWGLLGAALGPGQILAGLLAVGGVVVGLAPYRLPEIPRTRLLAGAAFAAAGALAQGVSWTLSKSAFLRLAESGEPLDGLTAAYQRLLGGVAVAGLCYLVAHWRRGQRAGLPSRDRSPLTRDGLLWSGANALAGPVLGVACMLAAIRAEDNPGLVQAIAATATLISVPFARRLEGRTLRWPFFLGASLSLVGVVGLLLLPR